MKKTIILLFVIITNHACAQSDNPCSTDYLENKLLTNISTFMKENESFLIWDKKYDYYDDTWIKYSRNKLTYFVNLISFDTNTCSLEIGFSGDREDLRNPLTDHEFVERYYKDISYIADIDSRKILFSFTDFKSKNYFPSLKKIRRIDIYDINYYRNLYREKQCKNDLGMYERVGMDIYFAINKYKETIIKYKIGIVDKDMRSKFINVLPFGDE